VVSPTLYSFAVSWVGGWVAVVSGARCNALLARPSQSAHEVTATLPELRVIGAVAMQYALQSSCNLSKKCVRHKYSRFRKHITRKDTPPGLIQFVTTSQHRMSKFMPRVTYELVQCPPQESPHCPLLGHTSTSLPSRRAKS
jgi:hypothetical protein